MNIFITGSEGFIGSHLTEALVKKVITLNVWFYIIHLIIGDG